MVSGAAQSAYDGTFVITTVSGNTFSYSASGSPTSPATGTITVQPYVVSTTTSYTDTSGISSQARYSYQVAAVNYDGVQGALSLPVSISPVGIAAISTPSTTSVLVVFSEAVDPVSAQVAGNYQITTVNVTVTSAVLESDDRTVLLTTSAALGTSAHTLTVSNVETLALSPLSTTPLTANFTYASMGWNVTVYEANIGLNDTIAMAQTLVNTPSEQSWVKTEVAPYIDYNVTGGVLHFPSKERTLPGTTMGTETDNFAVTATGMMIIPAAGTYTFGCDSDDGFQLVITGATFSSVTGEDGGSNTAGTNTLQYNGGRGVSDTLGVVTFSTAGDYPISLLWFQGGGGSACELYAAQGTYTNYNSSMQLVGDTADGGLSMGGVYVAPPFTVGVNVQSTNNTSPALSGTVTDPAAAVTVRVNGSYYAATNNGNGTWSLPQGDVSALGTGTYDVVVIGTNTSGMLAFDSTVNELSIGATSPTATITAPASPSVSPVSSIAMHFSEPVENFTLQDLQLTLTNGGVAASEPLEGATLTSSDNQNWTLGNLSALTSAFGTYSLTVTAAGWGITDMFGNPLLANATTSWTNGYPAVQSINTIGSNITNASSVQYAVTFSVNVTNVLAADFTLATNGAAGTIASVSGSGSIYTVTVNNVSGNGTLGLNLVDNNSIVDQYGDPLGGPALGDGNFTGQLYTIDNTAPTISIGAPSASYAAGGPVTYTVTYADANFNTSTLAAANITLNETGTAAGSISSVSGSGLTRTVTISGITGNGTLGISIAAGTASDLAGNLAPAAGPSGTFIVDNTAPTISIGTPSASYAAGGPVTYTVTYADANFNTSTLAAANITLNETGTAAGSISSVTGSGLTRTVTISGITGNGTLGISIAAGTASDLAGNLAPAAGPSGTFIVDNTAPTISIGVPSASYAAGGPVTYTVTYADANFNSSTLAAANITLNETGTAAGSISSVTGSGLTRTVTISGITGNGTLGISIAAGTASDLAGNLAPAAGPSGTFIVDNTAPTISIGAPSASYAAGGPVTYTVTYADANFNSSTLAAANITLNETGTAAGSISSVTGSGLTRTVTISGITGNGTLGISVAAGTASDLAGNLAPAAGPSGTFIVDNTAPTISIGAPSAAYAAGGPVTYTVTYADANFNTSTLAAANITLNETGTAAGSISSVSGSGLTRTVTISGITGNGTLGISVAAGTASDLAGNLAPAAGPSGTFIVDNTAPTISIGAPSAAYAAGGPVTYTVTYADANFNTSTLAAANITLNETGTAAGSISSVTGSGLTRTVTISGITGNGTLGISIAAGTASDLAGNLAPASGPSGTFIVDNTAPTISIGAPSASYVAGGPVTYTVTYADANFNSSTLAAANITLNETGSAAGSISSVSGSGLTRTVTISGITGNGTLGISIAAGTASDLAGNLAPAAGPSGTFIVDNTAPTISIGAPLAAYAAGGPVTYTVTYADANFNTSTLAAANITLNETGTAAGSISSVTGSGLTRTVTISGITGNGTLGISIAAGTASDLAGNLAPASGPSGTFIVDNTAPTISIGAPSAAYAAGGPVTYTVTYADANFNTSTLGRGKHYPERDRDAPPAASAASAARA